MQAFVQSVSSVSDVCCKRFYLDVTYVSHICCKSMFQIFQLFYSYVAVSVFMLLVYVLNILSASDLCCIKCFVFQRYVVCSESHGGTA